ncbi:hypothetical protein [Nocardia carnea]|uniref:hypothetical protein n=1 Tax=Nocardia carnea TaxID=37328 RepID=UPI0024580E0D|nr:hypothetical protein [Nocardia carnea]
MSRDSLSHLLLAGMVFVGGAGLVDAAIGHAWDSVTLFAIIVVLANTVAARSLAAGPSIGIRRDLAAWLTARSDEAGERADRIAARALSAYRAALIEDRDVR